MTPLSFSFFHLPLPIYFFSCSNTAQVTALREKMRKFQSGQKSRRAALASSADKAKNTLAEHVALAERVLALGAMARKKENERELVLPFATSSSEADQLDAEFGYTSHVVCFFCFLGGLLGLFLL